MSDKLTIQTIEYKRKITFSVKLKYQPERIIFACFAPTIECAREQALSFLEANQCKYTDITLLSIEQVLIT